MLLDTPICDFGWKAPDFTLKDASGKRFTMSEQLGTKGLLIAFICNHCPYVKRIGKRLAEDTALLMSEGINVLAVIQQKDAPSPNREKSIMSKSSNQAAEKLRKFGLEFPKRI